MGDGAARHGTALRGTEPCRLVTHQNKSLNFKMFWNSTHLFEAKKASPKTGHLSKREKSFFNGNWIQSSSRRTSAGGDSSAEDSSSSTTSSSVGLAISTPASHSNNVELLAKQVEKLENKLKERNEKLETATERLSDRELEISILQKRLELRGGAATGGGGNQAKNCSSCARKDGLISNLFEKVNLYESAILGTESLEVKDWDLDHILRNVGELNKLVAENERSVEYNDNGAKFLPNHTLQLAFYADGLQLDDGRFRLYNEKATKAFMKDLTDGFFPSELQVKKIFLCPSLCRVTYFFSLANATFFTLIASCRHFSSWNSSAGCSRAIQ